MIIIMLIPSIAIRFSYSGGGGVPGGSFPPKNKEGEREREREREREKKEGIQGFTDSFHPLGASLT